MIKRFVTKIINRFGVWRTIQAVIAGLSMILLTVAISQLFAPVPLEQTDNQTNNLYESAPENNSLPSSENKAKEQIAYRPGMFKPATGLQDKPLADKTIERIKDQLKLQCVMEMNGQPIAYINIQGVGLKKCGVGENVNDLFTVLDINKQNKSVDISIVEHKITLHL